MQTVAKFLKQRGVQLAGEELAILQTEDSIHQAKEQQARKGKLYQTMGVTIGALLVLLII